MSKGITCYAIGMSMAAISLVFGWLGLSDNEPSYRNWNGEQLAEELHPVRPHPMAQWQNAMSIAMSGRQASTLFRSTASKMDCYWRLSSTGEPLPSHKIFTTLFSIMRCSAHHCLEASIRSLFDRSPEWRTIRKVGRFATGPGIHWTRNENGPRLQIDDQSRRGRMAGQIWPKAFNDHKGSAAFHPPQVRMGTGIRLISSDELEAMDGNFDFDSQLALGAFLHSSHLTVDHLRMEWLWTNPGTRLEALSWTAALREEFHPIVAWVASARGSVERPLGSVRMTLEWHPSRFHPWVLRTGIALTEEQDFAPRAEIVLLARHDGEFPTVLQSQSRTPAPLQSTQWPKIPRSRPKQLTTIGPDSSSTKKSGPPSSSDKCRTFVGDSGAKVGQGLRAFHAT